MARRLAARGGQAPVHEAVAPAHPRAQRAHQAEHRPVGGMDVERQRLQAARRGLVQQREQQPAAQAAALLGVDDGDGDVGQAAILAVAHEAGDADSVAATDGDEGDMVDSVDVHQPVEGAGREATERGEEPQVPRARREALEAPAGAARGPRARAPG